MLEGQVPLSRTADRTKATLPAPALRLNVPLASAVGRNSPVLPPDASCRKKYWPGASEPLSEGPCQVPLALAAYNAGEGRVQGLLKKHQATTFDQIAARLPAETQMYVPKVEAALLRREGRKLNELRTQTK